MFNQNATGTVTVPVSGDWHCGPDNTSPKSFRYSVNLKYGDSALDSHGFLIDNLAFKAYFASLDAPVTESCELFVKRIVGDLVRMADKRAVLEARACIWPLDGVYVEYVWETPEYLEKPFGD